MGRSLSLVAILIVLAAGAGIYMRQAQSVAPTGSANPLAGVDLVGVKHDLMSIANAERTHNALHGSYGSLEELRSSGDLSMERSNRGPYQYSTEVSTSGFIATATYTGSQSSGAPRTISIDQSMRITQN